MRTQRIFSGLMLFLCATLGSAQPTAPTAAPAVAEDIEEIVIVGQRTLSTLRRQMEDAELRVYDVFNGLNDDRRYDIHCQQVAPIGSNIKRRRCAPQFADDAERDEALAFLEGHPVIPAAQVIAEQNGKLRERMAALAREHPEFLEALKEHYEASIQLKEARAAYFR
ncbi:MAG: hypothetical protein IT494_07980 [Gammaproteobacteria bacterium]|nr:hypothetical protein [Gammaproteobacteria bacterium]